MLYVEHEVGWPLDRWVRKLWYVRAPDAPSGRERVLPAGDTQVVINLARECCTGVGEHGETFAQAASLVVGTQRSYGLVDARDFAEMIGVVFRPGGLRRFVAEPAKSFRFAEVALRDVWAGEGELRERLREAEGPEAKFAMLERELVRRLRPGDLHAAMEWALLRVARDPSAAVVRKLSAETGYSSRRLGQLFKDEVGVGPKMFARILRFQRALRELNAGSAMRWDALALECGYCDQSHFANDFREFSGLNPTTFVRMDRPWANHVRVD